MSDVEVNIDREENPGDYQFFPKIPTAEPLVNQLITPEHANYERLRGHYSGKKFVGRFMLIVGVCVLGTYFVADKISATYENHINTISQSASNYASIGGSSIILSHQSRLSSYLKMDSIIDVMSSEEFKRQTESIVGLIKAGNEKALYSMPNVVVDGLRTKIDDNEILVSPSYQIITDPENPNIKFTGDVIGYTISGFIKYDKEFENKKKGKDGEVTITKFMKSVVSEKIVALRVDDFRVYELSDGEMNVIGENHIFDNYSDISNSQTFGYGLIEDSLLKNVSEGIISSGNAIIPSITDDVAAPEVVSKGMGYIIDFMNKNNGAILPQLEHEIISFKEFKSTGFADAVKKNYSTTKFVEYSMDGQSKVIMFSSSKVKDEKGVEHTKPVVGLFTDREGKYLYQNVDFGSDSRSKVDWVKLEGYETVSGNEIQRDFIYMAQIDELRITKIK